MDSIFSFYHSHILKNCYLKRTRRFKNEALTQHRVIFFSSFWFWTSEIVILNVLIVINLIWTFKYVFFMFAFLSLSNEQKTSSSSFTAVFLPSYLDPGGTHGYVPPCRNFLNWQNSVFIKKSLLFPKYVLDKQGRLEVNRCPGIAICALPNKGITRCFYKNAF